MTESKTSLADVRERIDSIDRQIQELISERANWAQEVARVKGEGLSAIDYYRPEREAHVLRMVVDRNKGPLPREWLWAYTGMPVRPLPEEGGTSG